MKLEIKNNYKIDIFRYKSKKNSRSTCWKWQNTDKINKTKTYLWVRRLNSVKISVLPKLICRFNTTLIQTSQVFVDIEKSILEFVWKDGTRTRIVKTIMKKKNKFGGLSDLKTYYSNQDSVILARVWTWEQCSRTESPEINPHKYSPLIFYRGAKII